MAVYTRRNALVGWAVTRVARKRLERKLNALAGNPRHHRRLAFGAVLTGTAVAVGVGTLAVRRAA
jgi:hypothetical protein